MISNLSLHALVFSPCFALSFFLSLSLLLIHSLTLSTKRTNEYGEHQFLLLIINQLIHHMLSRDMFIVYFFLSKFEYFMKAFQFIIIFFFQKVQSYLEWCRIIFQNFIWIHTKLSTWILQFILHVLLLLMLQLLLNVKIIFYFCLLLKLCKCKYTKSY